MPARQMPRIPQSRRQSLVILSVGTIAALACSLGPLWLTRVGLGIALLTTFVTVWLSWRQMDAMLVEHAAELKALRHQARDAAHAHHVEMMATIARHTKRQEALRAQLAEAQGQLGAVRVELTGAQQEAATKQQRISALNKRISDLEKQLAAAEDEVLNLPRRGLARRNLDVSNIPLVYPIQGQRRQA
ncbi:hypothetical protein AAEX63_02175 [Luteococcus sp. H138]|uniref:hypothetical protein n=1 Tax=unclassified Luteococcus TaxID=2639923 RepID=UPI00313CAB17